MKELEFKGTKGKMYCEYTELSSISPYGQITIKVGEAGTPIAALPIPLGGAKERQFSNAKLLASAPELLKALQGMVSGTTKEFAEINGFGDKREKAIKVITKALL